MQQIENTILNDALLLFIFNLFIFCLNVEPLTEFSAHPPAVHIANIAAVHNLTSTVCCLQVLKPEI